jgi:uncharacterized integral membrane protein (TIGR00697 family)
MNEILLIAQIAAFYGLVILAWKLFGRRGLYCWTAIATIAANIEVLVQIHAFGMDMTLGNILFASTFLATDVLSENCGKPAARQAVHMGVFASLSFLLISQSWLLFTPNGEDFAMPHLRAIFSNTPRLMITSFTVYAVVQRLDVFLYHTIWDWTEKLCRDRRRFLWVRNNGSTLVSQLFNNILFTFGAFYGVFPMRTLWSIVVSSMVIFIVTSLADTPVVYICRRIREAQE